MCLEPGPSLPNQLNGGHGLSVKELGAFDLHLTSGWLVRIWVYPYPISDQIDQSGKRVCEAALARSMNAAPMSVCVENTGEVPYTEEAVQLH
jgi:hypothetical protein